jgi:uncharacterized protein DUF6745
MQDSGGLPEEFSQQVPIWRQKWLGVASSCQPADRPTAEGGIFGLYRLAGLSIPQVTWVSSPTAMISVMQRFKNSKRAGIWWSPPELSLRRLFYTSLETSVDSALAPNVVAQLRQSLLTPLQLVRGAFAHHAGQHEAHWIAFFAFCRDVLGVQYEPEASHRLLLWEQIAQSCGQFAPYQDRVIVSERPQEQVLNADHLLHNEDGPALRYRDGCIMAWLFGLPIDPKTLLAPQTQTLQEIRADSDPESKGLRIARFAGRGTPAGQGLARYLKESSAQIIDRRATQIQDGSELLIRTADAQSLLIRHEGESNRVFAFTVFSKLSSCQAAAEQASPAAHVRPRVSIGEPMPLELLGNLDTGTPVAHPSRVFFSVMPNHEGYFGVLREFDVNDATRVTRLYGLKLNSQGMAVGGPVDLGPGEDPRLFIHGGKAYVLTFLLRGLDMEYFLVEVETGKRVKLLHGSQYGGKNWVPVMGQSGLWVIRSVVPLVILEVDPETGQCRTVASWDDDAITEYRGGSPAWRRGNQIVGFGHRTHHQHWHSPFHYAISLQDWSIEIRETVMAEPWNRCVVDPTSYWEDRLVCCRTGEGWIKIQPTEHGIFRIG